MPGDMGCRLFVGGLSRETTRESLRDHFDQFGDVTDAVVMYNNAGKHRGFGFVTFQNASSVEKVMNSGPHVIDGKEVDAKPTTARQSSPSGAHGHDKDKEKGKIPTVISSMGLERDKGNAIGLRSNPEAEKFKVFVGGIKKITDTFTLSKAFEKFGRVVDAAIIQDPQTREPKGYGFVQFDSEDAVEAAIRQRTVIVDGRKVDINYAKRSTQAPKPSQSSARQSAAPGGNAALSGAAAASFRNAPWNNAPSSQPTPVSTQSLSQFLASVSGQKPPGAAAGGAGDFMQAMMALAPMFAGGAGAPATAAGHLASQAFGTSGAPGAPAGPGAGNPANMQILQQLMMMLMSGMSNGPPGANTMASPGSTSAAVMQQMIHQMMQVMQQMSGGSYHSGNAGPAPAMGFMPSHPNAPSTTEPGGAQFQQMLHQLMAGSGGAMGTGPPLGLLSGVPAPADVPPWLPSAPGSAAASHSTLSDGAPGGYHGGLAANTTSYNASVVGPSGYGAPGSGPGPGLGQPLSHHQQPLSVPAGGPNSYYPGERTRHAHPAHPTGAGGPMFGAFGSGRHRPAQQFHPYQR